MVEFCLEALDTKGGHRDASIRQRYNGCIPQLLSRNIDAAPERNLFSRFRLRDDVAPYRAMEACSGYNAFDRAMESDSVSLEVKQTIDRAMRIIVLREQSGRFPPRTSHEAADHWYAESAFCSLYAEPSRQTELFESQLGFIVSWGPWSLAVLRDVRRHLRMLWRQMHGRVSHDSVYRTLVRRAILEGNDLEPFVLGSPEDLWIACRLQERFSRDTELALRLKLLILNATGQLGGEMTVAAETKLLDQYADILR
jgi:hypothetical protein